MEGTHIQPMEEDGAVTEEEMKINGEQEEAEMEASEEETDEDCEPEPPHVIRRKVSFADAFGLNLVSVKEFDNATESEVSQPPKSKAIPRLEEFYMCCLFTAPSSPEELDQRLHTQMVELESMELLPGTTTLRGTIRVVNLCYSKSVYARMTLDRWTSQFDLLAEYVPGSSDRKTDRFTFMYTLVPPFDREGARVEISLRYETSVGTFWANNAGLNYVLFCHQKGHVKEHVVLVHEESHFYKSKRSCLKAIMKCTAEENIEDSSNTSTAAAEAEATHKAEEANRRGSTDIESLLDREERNALVDSINSRHRAARLARVKEYLSQRSQHVPKARSHDSATSQGVSQPLPAQWVDSASFHHQRQKKQSNESPQVLTYHQIPLLTLDWNNDKAHERGAPEMRDIWTGTAQMTLSKASEEKTPSVNDMWEAFGNRTDDSSDKETSGCDVWQAFRNEPRCTERSAVPESEWLQTAASVSPSNDKEPDARNTASSQEQGFQVGTDTPTTLHAHTLAVCQLLSDSLPAEDLQPAEACVSSPRDDDTVTRDTSQRSQTNSVTDTPQIFGLKGATQVTEGSVDSSTECHEHTIWGQGREEIIGGAEGKGQDEPFTQYTHDLVTSSGESETTDMTAMPEFQNATADDRISQGLHEGLSSSREGKVTGTAQSMMDDKLAFTGTIRHGTKDEERFVFSTSRQGREEGMVNSCTENKAAADEEIFRPQKREECDISGRCADAKQHGEVRQNQNSENPLQENENEIKLAQKNADESNLSNTSEDASQKEDIGCEISPEEVMEKKSVAMKDTSTELQQQPETLESTDERVSHRDTDESIGELKIEVLDDLMGNVEDPQELSAEVESSTRVEYKRLSQGIKDSIIAGNTAALEVIESGLDEMFIERFGEDLISGIWEEVFGRRNLASNRDTDIVEGIGGKQAVKPDITRFEKDFNDALFLIELPTDQTLATDSKEFSPKESLSLTAAEQTNFLSQLPTDLNTSAHLRKDFSPIAAAQSSPSLTESARRSTKDQEHFTQTKERSVTCQETSRHIERFGEYLIGEIWDEVFGRREQASKGRTDIVDRTSELAVAGFFFSLFLFDFPAFFALYTFSLCWWFYKWKTHRVTTNKGMVGLAES
ncbi:hypothetical protein CgunFtcFv8_009719 [Champsocephalus gunnari]|uniref:CBM21 domain-containing protein n=1 Tax=Champsocephalus gunnari TaxID=52237 RepID=A0AAN8C3H5_CHAGU|nr:hypothetical protein CgunFtcFv8_009719 [Champsocephalus gunnari]